MMKTLLAQGLLLGGLTRINSVTAAPAQSPFRLRMNTNALSNIVHLRDQEVFKVFEDVELKDNEDLKYASMIKFSLQPNGVALDDFDLDVHLSKEYLGAETDKVTVSGTVTLKDGSDVPFTAPVPLVKLQYALGTRYDDDYKIDRNEYLEKEWVFKTGAVAGEGLSSAASTEIATAIDSYIEDFKVKFEKGGIKGEMDHIKDFPMDTVIPMAAVYYASKFAGDIDFADNFLELGFSLSHFKMLTEKQTNMLKEIKHDFYNEKNKDGYDALLQFTIDDNVFNSFATVFTSVDKTFSVRSLMKQNPKARPFISNMNTMILATIFPSFADNYGNDAPIDIMISPSHALFADGFPNSKMSGMYIDKNGNWKLQLNVPLTIMVEKPGKQWEEARQVYITMVFKFKLAVNDVSENTKKFSVTPKNLEVTNLKVLNEGQEEEMEQMMIQSVINIQLENLKKEFKEFPFHLSDLLKKNPKELQCLGFNIADLDIAFKKSQVQFSAYYKETKYQNKKLCDDFLSELRESPNKFFSQFTENEGLMKSIQEAQKLSAGDKTANPFEGMADLSNMAKPKKEQAKPKAKQEEPMVHEDL